MTTPDRYSKYFSSKTDGTYSLDAIESDRYSVENLYKKHWPSLDSVSQFIIKQALDRYSPYYSITELKLFIQLQQINLDLIRDKIQNLEQST